MEWLFSLCEWRTATTAVHDPQNKREQQRTIIDTRINSNNTLQQYDMTPNFSHRYSW